MLRIYFLALSLCFTTAFHASRTPATIAAPNFQNANSKERHSDFTTQAPLTSLHVMLTEEESKQILELTNSVYEGECTMEDVSYLVINLQEQQKVLEDRLAKTRDMIHRLQHLNEKDGRKTNEVRSFIRDLLRAFDTSQPKSFPMGFSGEIKGGPKTAFDLLPPKHWTPPGGKR